MTMLPDPGTGPAAQRVLEGHRVWRVSTELFAQAVELIADAEHSYGPDLIIGIRRGGAPVAAALAELMGVRRALVSARHNPSDQIAVQATGHVDLNLAGLGDDPAVAGRRVLLVDDICGSGTTVQAVSAALGPVLDPACVRVAVLCRNTGSQITPDSWVWDVSDWTVFPWEQRPAARTEVLPVPTQVRHP